MVRVSLGDSIIDLKRFSVNLGAEYEFISFYFRIIDAKCIVIVGAEYLGQQIFLNTYELADDLNKWKVIEFKRYDEAWLDFVTECRQGRVVGDYDVVIGGIANDKVFRTVDLYFAGDISKEECLRRLIFEEPNNQICIRSQQVLNECLTFKSSQRL